MSATRQSFIEGFLWGLAAFAFVGICVLVPVR